MTESATRSWLKEERISGLLGGYDGDDNDDDDADDNDGGGDADDGGDDDNDDDNDDACADADDGGYGKETHLMTLGFRHLSVDKDFQQAVLCIN